jgi:hypothetical protein
MDFLKLTNVDDLFTVCDQDNDGFLNEDEQILILSLIKVKMLTLADKLCKIQKYTLYKKLMSAMRKLEQLINVCQHEVRHNIYDKEIELYHQIGENMLDRFYKKFYDLFQEVRPRAMSHDLAQHFPAQRD